MVLEKEPANGFVGVKVEVDGMKLETQYTVEGFDGIVRERGTVTFPDSHRWRYRSSKSRGSVSGKVAGLMG